jgi:hypothetical protein
VDVRASGAHGDRLGREFEEVLMTTAEKLIAEGEAKGLAKGEAMLLLKLLRLKFGPVSQEVDALVSGATSDQLEAWGERILSATELRDVFS